MKICRQVLLVTRDAEPLCTNGTALGTPDAPFAPETRKSTRENFGKPAKKYSDQLCLYYSNLD